MPIHQLTHIGSHHVNHCEDYTVAESLGPGRWLCAVLDGCTMGTDSYFAATLTGKLLRKLALEHSYQNFYERTPPAPPPAVLRELLRQLMGELKTLKNQLQLRDDELLTTLLVAVVDEAGPAQVLAIGDGVVGLNGELTEFEQNNIPDYLGYHLHADFDAWYDGQHQVLTAARVHDLALSTDGVFTFARPGHATAPLPLDPVALLLTAPDDAPGNLLQRRRLQLEQHYGLLPTDDLGIVRLLVS